MSKSLFCGVENLVERKSQKERKTYSVTINPKIKQQSNGTRMVSVRKINTENERRYVMIPLQLYISGS